MHGGGQGQLAVGRYLVPVILQQPRDVGVGQAVVVAAEADVVLLELNGPKRGVQLPVLVLAVRVDGPHEAHQEDDQDDDDGQDDDVELRPRDVGESRRAVVRGADGESGGHRCLDECAVGSRYGG